MALPNKAPPTTTSAHMQAGGTLPHSQYRDPRMTAKAQNVPYSAFMASGWTEAEMRAADYLK